MFGGKREVREQYSGSSVDATEGYRYNERNDLTERISAGSLTRYSYDKNGSIISEEKEGRRSEYRYDLLNRQTYVKTLDGKEQENFYDGEGLRAGLTENGKRTTFLYHNGEILTESDGESTPIRRYVRGNGLSCVQTLDNDTYHAYHQNEQGSTAYITGQGVENCYQYDAFGNLTEQKETITNRILFTGQQYDQETEQYYLRARYYNPVVGRFLQEDTYRGDGLNLYAYCANNPVTYYDPSGHECKGQDKKVPDKTVGEKTFISEYDIPTNDKGYTKSSLELGQKVHKEYKAGDVDGIFRTKEYRLPSGKRPDFVDTANKIVYELKPNNPRQIKKGIKQLEGYLEELNGLDGGGWRGVLDTY